MKPREYYVECDQGSECPAKHYGEFTIRLDAYKYAVSISQKHTAIVKQVTGIRETAPGCWTYDGTDIIAELPS